MNDFNKYVNDAVKSIKTNGIWLNDFEEKNTKKDNNSSHYAPNKLILSNDDIADFVNYYEPIINLVQKDRQSDATKELLLRLNELKKVNSMLKVHSQLNEVKREVDAHRNIKRIFKAIDTILDSMQTPKTTQSIAQRTLIILLKLFKRQAKRLYHIPNSYKEDSNTITYNIFNIKSYRKLYDDKNKSKHLVQMIKEFGKRYNIPITQHTITPIKNNTSLLS
ncbi:MAG: hypothetical protein GQ531_09880 [Sulfurovum sp.]|nr:hypothetical protein [Sulfurovum sp.]